MINDSIQISPSPVPHSANRAATQISDTIGFEFIKNGKKLLILMGISGILVALGYLVATLQYPDGVVDYLDTIEFASYLLNNLNIFLYISACALGGSMLCADFEKDTKNLLFPNISRFRLFVGRLIANALMQLLVLVMYYAVVVGIIGVIYREIPKEVFISFAWAILFAEAVLCFVIFFSSFMRTVTGTVVLTFLLLFMGYNILNSIFMFSTATEPLVLLTYYANFITAIMQMPETRYINQSIDTQGINLPLNVWLTPSVTGYWMGLTIHILLFLISAYFLFIRRQEK